MGAARAGLMFFCNWTYFTAALGPERSGNWFLKDKRVNRPAIGARVVPPATRCLHIARRVVKRACPGIVCGDLQKGNARATGFGRRLEGGKTGAGKPLAAMIGIGGQRQKLGLIGDGAAKGKGTRIADGKDQRALHQVGDLLCGPATRLPGKGARMGPGQSLRRHRQE